MQKVAVKVCENKTSVISMNGGCVGNSCIAHAFIASTYTFFTYSPKSNIKSFPNDRIDVESVFIVELSWRKENIRRRYFLICHLVLKKYEKNTDVEDKVAWNQRTYLFFLFVIHGSISVEMKTMFFEYFSHISLLRHVLKTCQNWIREHFLSIVVHVHTLLVRKSNFFFNYVKHIQFWNFIMICLGTSSSTYITK